MLRVVPEIRKSFIKHELKEVLKYIGVEICTPPYRHLRKFPPHHQLP